MGCPSIIIGAIASGAGKTTLALSITRALALRGLQVQTFKVGPDFLDPTHLALASGRPCYNLDSWMCGKAYVLDLYARKTADADVAIIEGVMGLFDGASPDAIDGSTAEIAKLLDAPVWLTVNVRGMARSLAALVQGACNFEPGIRICGVIANHCGSERHADILQQALTSANLPPLIGAIPTGAFPELASRHLGLIAANPESLQTLDTYAALAEQYLQLETLLEEDTHQSSPVIVARNRPPIFDFQQQDSSLPSTGQNDRSCPEIRNQKPCPSLAVAQDDAFSFYYPDTLEALEQAGVQIIPFSPLRDTTLPAGIQGIYFGGGYPELHASSLAANTPMLKTIRRFAQSGGFIYAECGGMMYLSESIETLEGTIFPMTGLLPLRTRMAPKRKVLGYVEVTLTHDSLWGKQGQSCRGHEFHYSDIIPAHHLGTPGSSLAQEPAPKETIFPSSFLQLPPAYICTYRGNRAPRPGGFRNGNILADYIHLHWASHPTAINHFIESIGATS